ncbi:MAG: phytoene desaturase family protein [Phycisphaerae bacterium]
MTLQTHDPATSPWHLRARPGRRVVVIGGGVGGLAAAVRLAARGVAVTLLEKNPRLGGKLNLWEAPHPHRTDDRPFRFDTGPSLLTLPFVFQDLFKAAGFDARDMLPITPLAPVSRFVWADGQTFELSSDEERMLAEVRRFAPDDEAGFTRFYDYGRNIWNLAGELFLAQAPEQIIKRGDLSPMQGLAMASTPFRIGMFKRFHAVVDKHIRSQRLREVLYQYATYSGASPFKAPATLAVIPYAELHFGGWYPVGGMYRIAEALAEVAKRLGVDVRTEAPVRRILIEKTTAGRKTQRRAVGVELDTGERLDAAAVIANADVVYTYRKLIDPEHRPHYPDDKLDRLEPGGSGMVLLLGVEGTYPQLAHHTKFMPEDYTSDLRAMFDNHTVPDDPCIYVAASTRTDPTQAPQGCENLFVLASAPAIAGPGRKVDWARQAPQYRDKLVHMLEHRFGLTDLANRIVVEKSWCPMDLLHTYNANAGSIYGIGSNSRMQAFLRPPNRDKAVSNLFFCGGATHPGGGLPLVALSGKIASEMAEEEVVGH